MVRVGSVLGISRYPVKSMGGESLARVATTVRGLHGDRAWAVYTSDGGIGSGKTTRRFRRIDGLLELRSRLCGDVPVIEFPDGGTGVAGDPDIDRRLSVLLGRRLTVRAETTVAHHDEAPVHVLTTASLRHLGELLGEPVDPRRMRANLLLDVDGAGFAEDAWKGRHLRVGDSVVLSLGDGMPRCAMVNVAQPALPHEHRLLKLIAHANDLALGLKATVASQGEIVAGDPVFLV